MNSYKTVNYGKKASRRNYSKVRTEVDLPNLIEIQTKSFQEFVDKGLGEIFEDISPITSYNEDLKIYFGEYHFEDPKYGIVESKLRDTNYSRALKCRVRLENCATGAVSEDEIFMGDIPYMTPVGTFVINGAERVVISQIVRSAGVYFRKEVDTKSGELRYAGQVIPTRGAWIEFEAGPRDIWYGKLDRSKKIPITTLLRAFGLSTDKQIIDLFGDNIKITETLKKDTATNSDEGAIEVYSKLRQGEKVPADGARSYLVSHLFDNKRYDLQKVGRFKYNVKLDVFDRAKGHILAENIIAKEDVFDDETGEILFTEGELIASAGELIVGDVLAKLKKARSVLRTKIDLGETLCEDPYCEILNVEVVENDQSKIVKIIGSDQRETALHITMSDIIASFSYYFNLNDGVGRCDDIDHLGNRRLRLIGELLKNQFRIGLAKLEKNIVDRMSTIDIHEATPKSLVNTKPLSSSLREFFGSSQLSQFMDQINPLAEITQKRRVSALGTGGIARDRAGAEVRDVHDSHYGRMCPIETPEGPSIGLITSLATYAKVNEFGFIETPYLIAKRDENGKKYISEEMVYLSADKEEGVVIASASTKLDDKGYILNEYEDENGNTVVQQIIGRINGETSIVSADDIDYMDVSPKQVVSVAAACIPFLEHDDATRALMGANMQRQAVPIIAPESPIVGTGMEYRAAKDSGSACVAISDGVVEYVDAKKIVVKETTGDLRTYELYQFLRSNSSTTIWQRPIVKVGEVIEKGDVLADGQSMQNGELALGRNVRVGFMTWDGYNFEDAVIMSENMVKNDVYTSVHIDEYEIECRDTKLGKEEFTRDIPNVGEEMVKYLDQNGVIVVGTEVKEGDILVGKVTPKGQSDPTPEERLLAAIFGEKSREVRDTSLHVPHGGGGVVRSVEHFKKSNGDELAPGVNEVIRVYIVQKRKISEGDKMAGRHGNKGVISNILPVEDMPYSADGKPLDIMLNPQGVPSRMNIGQVLELHLGLAASKLGIKVATPVFDGATQADLDGILKEAGCPLDGKIQLFDGRSGEPFENRINVGIMYMIKLSHMVDDKLHARSVGPYTLVTQQPMGGKAQNGGQRFGEMEVWALQAYGAAHTLQEMLTVKSDDIVGRNKVFRAIVDGKPIPEASIPESFRVLTREFQSLGLHVELIAQDGTNEVNKSLVDPNSDDFISKFGM
ncbi:MAG: DNA-directed RNA polymerase subunit beta [Anaeroplasmataceae bacterium]